MNASPPFDFDADAIADAIEVAAPIVVPKPAKAPKEPKDLSEVLELAIRKVLRDKDTKPADRVKAIEAGTKLLSIKHKIEGGGNDGNFFGK